MSNSIKFSKLFIGLILIFLFISGEMTFSQSSTNYKIEKSVIDQGGGVSQTNDKNVNSVIGQASSSGSSISSNYIIFTGFFTGDVLAGSNNLSGVVNYYSNSKPVKNVALKLNEITINSGNDGSYRFANLANSNYTLLPTKTGDINAAIGAYDASMILRYS
ncbi:hypothetical protein JW964_04910, partial [candidate division KSB1 bacterium]|nr:hypothetical protein [candidate division KSB1 bacterium]